MFAYPVAFYVTAKLNKRINTTCVVAMHQRILQPEMPFFRSSKMQISSNISSKILDFVIPSMLSMLYSSGVIAKKSHCDLAFLTDIK